MASQTEDLWTQGPRQVEGLDPNTPLALGRTYFQYHHTRVGSALQFLADGSPETPSSLAVPQVFFCADEVGRKQPFLQRRQRLLLLQSLFQQSHHLKDLMMG
jgi:hypothetical protein